MKNSIKPMKIGTSLLFFGIPAVLLTFLIYKVGPYMHKQGASDILIMLITLMLPMVLMLIASIVFLKKEHKSLSWKIIKTRFRLKKMTGRDWLWTLGLVVLAFLSMGILSFTVEWLLTFDAFSPPEYILKDFDPRVLPQDKMSSYLGYTVSGNWWLVLLCFIFLLFNIIGEEFWWRGYIMPRQELEHKKYTWIIHGLLWNLFHVFWKWNLIMILPVALVLPFIVQKRKNTWIGIISHLIINSLGLIVLIYLVAK